MAVTVSRIGFKMQIPGLHTRGSLLSRSGAPGPLLGCETAMHFRSGNWLERIHFNYSSIGWKGKPNEEGERFFNLYLANVTRQRAEQKGRCCRERVTLRSPGEMP